jgi:hypothetical protein
MPYIVQFVHPMTLWNPFPMHTSNKREIPRVLTMWQDIQVENVMIEERGIGDKSRESRPRKMVSLALQVECVWVKGGESLS